jgi:hypothetical protein
MFERSALSTACSTPIHFETTPCACPYTSLYVLVASRLASPMLCSNPEEVSTRRVFDSGGS